MMQNIKRKKQTCCQSYDLMTDEKKPVPNFMQKLKERAADKRRYGHEMENKSEAGTSAIACPNCGAARAKDDNLTHCSYCGIEREQRAADLKL